MNNGLRLKIRQEGLSPHSAHVWLNDMEISQGINAMEVKWNWGEVTTAHLTITVNELDVDTATIAYLEAHVKPVEEVK